MKVYFAHPVTDYGNTERQRSAIAALEARGCAVENPDKPWHQRGYDSFGMAYFTDLVGECDALAFLRFPNGSVGAGVGREIETALTRRMEVWDITNDFALVTMMPPDVLSVDATRAEIAALRRPSSLCSHDDKIGGA